MPQPTPLLESLEMRSLFAAGVSELSCPVSLYEFGPTQEPQCLLSELNALDESPTPETLLRPMGTSKIDHYPESKGWFGDLWDYALLMLGWN